MNGPYNLEMLLALEIENALALAGLGARNASKIAERIAHVAGGTDPRSVVSLRASAMRLRIAASEFQEVALNVTAEATRLDLVAAFREGFAAIEERERRRPK